VKPKLLDERPHLTGQCPPPKHPNPSSFPPSPIKLPNLGLPPPILSGKDGPPAGMLSGGKDVVGVDVPAEQGAALSQSIGNSPLNQPKLDERGNPNLHRVSASNDNLGKIPV
jgi:hypothetical protein